MMASIRLCYYFKFLMKLSMLYSSEYCSSPHSSGRLSSTDLTPPPELGVFTGPACWGDSEKRSRTWSR